MKISSIAAVLIMVLMAISADFFLKIAGEKEGMLNRYFFAGMAIYSLTAFVWYFVLKNIELSSANLVYSVLTVIISVFVGIFFFKEKVTLIESVAYLMAITSIFILSRFSA